MSNVVLRWVGDLDQDKREQAGCVSSSSDQYRPRKIEFKSGQKEIRIGRTNSKSPPDFAIESCINQRMISRNHATIERSAKGGCILYDHSMNGTYVNYTRVIGGVTLKHGDIVCFGHLNGANLKPGDKVSLFYSDLKYKVEISDNVPSKDAQNIASRKRKSQAGSTVSSTQRSDGEENVSDDSSEDLSPSKSKGVRQKSFKKADSDDSDDESALSDKRSLVGKSSKKRSNGHEKLKKAYHSTSASRKPSIKPLQSKEKRPRSSKANKGALDDNDEDAKMFHYDTEECSARPCKQPQDMAIDWIQCDKCTLWYHQVCLGLKPSEANVDTYYCPYCKKSS